jgi:hypothetical protein
MPLFLPHEAGAAHGGLFLPREAGAANEAVVLPHEAGHLRWGTGLLQYGIYIRMRFEWVIGLPSPAPKTRDRGRPPLLSK